MKTWQIRTIGVLTFVGSLVGAVLMLVYSSQIWPNILAITILSLFLIAFSYGIYVGTQILKGSNGAAGRAIPFWAVQIPVFSSDVISFRFNTGASASVYATSEGILGVFPFVGSFAEISLGATEVTTIGVNVLAVAVVVTLVRNRDKAL